MKKLLSIAVVGVAFVAAAAHTPTTVGLTKVTTTQKSTIVPVAFKSLSTGENILVKDLVKAANLPPSTLMYVYNGTTYYAYTNSNGTWAGVDVVEKIDGVNTPTKGSASLPLAAGGAVWIVLQNAPATSQDIYIYGAYATGITSTAAAGVSTLVANPLQSEATVTITGATKGDVLLIPTGDNSNPDRYVCLGETDSVTYWKHGLTKVSAIPAFPMGKGFWYTVAGSSPVTISWK